VKWDLLSLVVGLASCAVATVALLVSFGLTFASTVLVWAPLVLILIGAIALVLAITNRRKQP
jgi:hypothetical protein